MNRGPQRHILTINVEDYYQVGAFSHLIPYREWERFEHRINRNLATTLALLQRTGSSATFFVTGWMAENHPEIFPAILAAGHEIAGQGYYQQSIRGLPPLAFRDDIRRSKTLIETVVGQQVLGFRVGRGWIGPEDVWALDVIRDEGYRYDASFCPLARQFSRLPQFEVHDPARALPGGLYEVPISALSFLGYSIPFAGGNYLRQLPGWFTRYAVSRWTTELQRPLVAYFHIWELDDNQPDITAAGALQKIRHYRNLSVMRERLEALLEAHEFISASAYLDLHAAPATTIPDADQSSPAATAIIDSPLPGPARELTLVVPCYNEEASIPYLARTLRSFAAKAAHAGIALAYVFVDDGSTDSTSADLQREFGACRDAQFRILERNLGIAAAILAGVDAAESDLVAVIDADCTFDPHQLLEMLPLLNDDISVVAASPFHAQGSVMHVPQWRLWLSKSAAFLYRQVMRNQLTSYTSCFRIYRRQQLLGMSLDNTGFCGVTEILARLDLAGHKVIETPAVLQVRLLGQSKIRLLRVIFDHLRLISRIFLARYFHMDLR